MKLYAVVIGRKDRNKQRVAHSPFLDYLPASENLAVYETRNRARIARKQILARCGHKNVHVIPFVAGREQ